MKDPSVTRHLPVKRGSVPSLVFRSGSTSAASWPTVMWLPLGDASAITVTGLLFTFNLWLKLYLQSVVNFTGTCLRNCLILLYLLDAPRGYTKGEYVPPTIQNLHIGGFFAINCSCESMKQFYYLKKSIHIFHFSSFYFSVNVLLFICIQCVFQYFTSLMLLVP